MVPIDRYLAAAALGTEQELADLEKTVKGTPKILAQFKNDLNLVARRRLNKVYFRLEGDANMARSVIEDLKRDPKPLPQKREPISWGSASTPPLTHNPG